MLKIGVCREKARVRRPVASLRIWAGHSEERSDEKALFLPSFRERCSPSQSDMERFFHELFSPMEFPQDIPREAAAAMTSRSSPA